LYLLDPIKGRGQKVLEKTVDVSGLFAAADPAISPDGQHIALLLPGRPRNRIRIVNLHGATEREITVSGADFLLSLDWSADGTTLFSGEGGEETERLLRVQRNGASQVMWSNPGVGIGIWGVPSPDGRYLATFKGNPSANVWTVENP